MTKMTYPRSARSVLLLALALPLGTAMAQTDSDKTVSTEPPGLVAQQEVARDARSEAIMQGRFDRNAEAHGQDPYQLKIKPSQETSTQKSPSQKEDATGTLDYARLLKAEEHPMPLDCGSAEVSTQLGIYPPSVTELRLMLPGRVSDFLDSTSAKVQKFISDTISAGEQARAKQRAKVSAWTENVLRIRGGLAEDPWVQYQFALEVNRYAKPCLDQIASQSDKSLKRYAAEAQRAVNDLTPILPALPDAHAQTEVYRVMLQLRDSAALARSRFEDSEGEALRTLNQLLKLVPQLDRPAGEPPTKVNKVKPEPSAQVLPSPIEHTPSDSSASHSVPREAPARSQELKPAPALESTPVDITHKDSGSGIFGYLFIGLALALSLFGVMRFVGRRREAKASKK